MLKTSLPLLLVATLAVSCASSKTKEKEANVASINFTYGTQFLMAKDYTQALIYLQKAAELDPTNSDVHVNLGMAYYFKGDKTLAKQHITRALELNPKNTDARSNLASFYFEEGDLRTAEKIYRECLTDLTYEKQARVYFNLALIELRKGSTQNAMGYLNLSVKEDESYCAAWNLLGTLAYQAKNLEKATAYFKNSGMGTCADTATPLLWQAQLMMDKGEYLNARLKLDELTGRFPNSEEARTAKEKLSQLSLLERRMTDQSLVTPARDTKSPTF